MNLTAQELLQIDAKHLWHPYTSIEKPLNTYLVESADGVRLRLHDGRELIDGMASWWCMIHGYNHPVLNEAINHQTSKMAHVMFGGLTHRPAIELAQKILDITPEPLNRLFFADSGSVAVEVAMKMAIQYYHARNTTGKNRFVTVQSGYHGDTFHAMSVCDPTTGMHSIYKGVLPEYFFAETIRSSYYGQYQQDDTDSIEEILKKHANAICGIILEPIVQGAGGMRFYHPEYLRRIRKLCDQYDVLLILDEIATGFGRTGELFGCNHASVTPDILCLGKALTGGYMTLAAVLATQEVGRVISNGPPGVFMHGPTFMANPLACAVASASIDLLMAGDWRANIGRIESELQKRLAPCKEFATVAEVRVLGAIGVVEMKRSVDMQTIQKRFVDKGVWVRPFGRLVYVMPPFIMNNEDLVTLCKAICDVTEETES